MLSAAIEETLTKKNVDINICNELISQLLNLY